MLILADYEGLAAGIGLILGLIVMAPAFLLGLGGTIAGSMNPPRRKLAAWFGAIGVLLGIAATALALSGYWQERNHVDARGNHFTPPPLFYLAVTATLGISVYSLYRGLKRHSSPAESVSNK